MLEIKVPPSFIKNCKWAIQRYKLYLLNLGYRYLYWLRTTDYLSSKRFLKPLFIFARFRLIILSHKTGIQVPENTIIGKSLYLGHYCGIVINPEAVLGDNINLSNDVTIGQTNRGEKKGSPKLVNCIYVGPGARIIGNITIGNKVAIWANAVVTKDIPDNAVVVGSPAKIIS